MAQKQQAIAFIYHDGQVDTGTAHWRIIQNIWKGDIAEFLYRAMENPDHAWGWIWPTNEYAPTGRQEVVVEFATEIAPHFQNHKAIPAAVEAIQREIGVDVIDIETPAAEDSILQRFTPSGIPQSAPDPVSYGQGEPRTWKEPAATETQDAGDLKLVTLKRDQVGDVIINTVDLRAFAQEDPYGTVIIGGGMDGSMYPSATSDTALHTHDRIVQLVKDFEAGKFNAVKEYLPEEEKPDHKFFSRVAALSPEQMHLMDAPGLSVIKVKPPPDATHSNKEKPFLYYRPTHTVFETTDYCHHGHVIPMITQAIMQHGNGFIDYGSDAWINGDITDPDSSGQNWIKFIHPGPIPKSVIDYFKGKYPDREVIYNTDNGWEPLEENSIDKSSAIKTPEELKEITQGSFGFVNGHLIIAGTHHQAIMAALLENGWTWEDLFEVPQAWGWFYVYPENYYSTPRVELRFSSDAGFQSGGDVTQGALRAMSEVFGIPAVKETGTGERGVRSEDTYGTGLKGKRWIVNYQEGGSHTNTLENYIYSPIPPPPVPPKVRPDWLPDNLHMVPTNFPPPKKAAIIRDMEDVVNNPYHFCFGYLEDTDTLYLGDTHHASIIATLVGEGMSWETLMSSRQMWGWAESNESYHSEYEYNPATGDYEYVTPSSTKSLNLRFATDEARQDKGIKPKVLAAFKQAFPDYKIYMPTGYGYKSQEAYGDRAKEQYLNENPSWRSDDDSDEDDPYN